MSELKFNEDSMNTIREFTSLDWSGYAGAKRFYGTEKNAPLIADIRLQDRECDAEIIIDRDRVALHYLCPLEEYHVAFTFEHNCCNQRMARVLLEILAKLNRVEQFVVLGFEGVA